MFSKEFIEHIFEELRKGKNVSLVARENNIDRRNIYYWMERNEKREKPQRSYRVQKIINGQNNLSA